MDVRDIDEAIARIEEGRFSLKACEALRTLYAVRSQLVKRDRARHPDEHRQDAQGS